VSQTNTSIEDLHARVDADAERVAARHPGRLRCGRGCAGCCSDGLTVFEVEAARIRRAHGALLEEGEPHPEGACAFLDAEGACRIYPDRPYVCRTQGLPLRWLTEDEEGGEIVEERDICALNVEGPPLSELPEEDLWLLGPVEERLAALQHEADGGVGRRVALRALFRRR
jgi:Fe-S-cluster containining protein